MWRKLAALGVPVLVAVGLLVREAQLRGPLWSMATAHANGIKSWEYGKYVPDVLQLRWLADHPTTAAFVIGGAATALIALLAGSVLVLPRRRFAWIVVLVSCIPMLVLPVMSLAEGLVDWL
jgi:hypothetical protein